jgi:hypothetical protein
MPVWLHDVDSLAIAHPVPAADDVREVDRVVGQRGQFGAQPVSFRGVRGVVVDRLVGRRRHLGDRVHAASILGVAKQTVGRSDNLIY